MYFMNYISSDHCQETDCFKPRIRRFYHTISCLIYNPLSWRNCYRYVRIIFPRNRPKSVSSFSSIIQKSSYLLDHPGFASYVFRFLFPTLVTVKISFLYIPNITYQALFCQYLFRYFFLFCSVKETLFQILFSRNIYNITDIEKIVNTLNKKRTKDFISGSSLFTFKVFIWSASTALQITRKNHKPWLGGLNTCIEHINVSSL